MAASVYVVLKASEAASLLFMCIGSKRVTGGCYSSGCDRDLFRLELSHLTFQVKEEVSGRCILIVAYCKHGPLGKSKR